MHPTHEFKRHKRGGGGGEANVVSYENTPARYVARKGVRGTGEEEDETRNEQIEADTDRGIKEEGEGERGVRDGMDATQYAVLAVSWLPRCPGGERLNTSGLLLLPPLFAPFSLGPPTPPPLIRWNGLMLLIHVHKVLG